MGKAQKKRNHLGSAKRWFLQHHNGLQPSNVRRCKRAGFGIANMLLAALLVFRPSAAGQDARDWITALPREAIHVEAWPDGAKVAVCFVLYVEVWGYGHGPNFRSDMQGRDPDVVDESFRQYAIHWGIPRVGRLFYEQNLPLSVAVNAQFPSQYPDVWKQFRSVVPNAPLIAHGVNNSTQLLPLGRGLDSQAAYIRQTLDMIEKDTGVRPVGWSSPSVYPNGDTFTAAAGEGIRYSLDGMDSDILPRLNTKLGSLVLPYPAVTVDMGQYLSRAKEPHDIERLWVDYVSEMAREAKVDPSREATVIAIGLHPFVVGTPAGAAALRRVLENFKQQKSLWISDVEQVLRASGDNH